MAKPSEKVWRMNVIIILAVLTSPVFLSLYHCHDAIAIYIAIYMIFMFNSNVADQRYPKHCMIYTFSFAAVHAWKYEKNV